MDPSWSPDGARIVFISNPKANPTFRDPWFVHAMDPDGGNVTNLRARALSFQSRPVFSPDGQKIAFAGLTPDASFGFGDIFLMNPDGSGLEKLTPPSTQPKLAGRYPVWSPDGKTIAFQGLDPTATPPVAVYLMDLETRELTKLTNFSAEPHAWAWFPEGSERMEHER